MKGGDAGIKIRSLLDSLCQVNLYIAHLISCCLLIL